MPRRKNNRRNKRKGKRGPGNQASGPPASSQTYRGPIRTTRELSDANLKVMVLSYQVTIASDSGGSITTVFGSSPASASNWADTNTVWSEFRTLGFEMIYHPINRYSKTTTTCVPIAVVLDRRNSTALSSYTQATAYESCRILSLEDPWGETIRMMNAEESQFQNVSAPVSVSWLKLYGTGFSISTSYGIMFIIYRVQFRNPA